MICGVADLFLAPTRYLFGGRTIRILSLDNNESRIDYVAAFHPCGEKNVSSTNAELRSDSQRMWKTALAVVMLVPGLIVGSILKGIAFLPCVSDLISRWNTILINLQMSRIGGLIDVMRDIGTLMGDAVGRGIMTGIGEQPKGQESKNMHAELEEFLAQTPEELWRHKIVSCEVINGTNAFSIFQGLNTLCSTKVVLSPFHQS